MEEGWRSGCLGVLAVLDHCCLRTLPWLCRRLCAMDALELDAVASEIDDAMTQCLGETFSRDGFVLQHEST